MLRGELALDRGEADAARAELGAERLLGPSPGAAVRAGVVGLGGGAASGDPAGAAAGYDEAAKLLRQVGLYGDMARASPAPGTPAAGRTSSRPRSTACSAPAAVSPPPGTRPRPGAADEAAQIADQVHEQGGT